MAFEAAARHGSFGMAAKALGTSQPAISQRIGNLEAMLAVPLFRRASRGVHLTPQGGALLAGLVEGLDRIAQAVETARGPSLSHLTVATDFGFAAFWLIPRLPSLCLYLPEINVRVATSQDGFDVQRDPADVAIAFGSGRWPGCTAELLVPETVLPVCSPAFAISRARPGTPADLQTAPLLHLEAGPEARWLDWPGFFRGLGTDFTPGESRISIDNYSLVLQAALAGQGIALGWRPLVDDLLSRGLLVAALDRTVTTENGYYVVHRRAEAGGRTGARFRAWLRAQVNPALEGASPGH